MRASPFLWSPFKDLWDPSGKRHDRKVHMLAQLTTTVCPEPSVGSKVCAWQRTCHHLPAKQSLVTQTLTCFKGRGKSHFWGWGSWPNSALYEHSLCLFWYSEFLQQLLSCGKGDWIGVGPNQKEEFSILSVLGDGKLRVPPHMGQQGCPKGNKCGHHFTKNHLQKPKLVQMNTFVRNKNPYSTEG